MKTALARKPVEPEAPDMSPSENVDLAGQVTELHTDLRYFQADVDRRFEAVDKRFDAVDKRFDGIDKRLDGVDKRFDGIDKRLDGVEKKVDDLRDQFSDFKDTLNGAKIWAITMYIGLAASLLYIIAKAARWL